MLKEAIIKHKTRDRNDRERIYQRNYQTPKYQVASSQTKSAKYQTKILDWWVTWDHQNCDYRMTMVEGAPQNISPILRISCLIESLNVRRLQNPHAPVTWARGNSIIWVSSKSPNHIFPLGPAHLAKCRAMMMMLITMQMTMNHPTCEIQLSWATVILSFTSPPSPNSHPILIARTGRNAKCWTSSADAKTHKI